MRSYILMRHDVWYCILKMDECDWNNFLSLFITVKYIESGIYDQRHWIKIVLLQFIFVLTDLKCNKSPNDATNEATDNVKHIDFLYSETSCCKNEYRWWWYTV